MNRLRKVSFFPAILIILAPLILLAPVYALGKALFWGTPLLQFVPWWSYAWSNILAGNFPLWNSQVGMGAPLFANYQSALLYPPNWIYFLLYVLGRVPLMAWGQSLLVAFHLIWAGIGMTYIVRRLGLSPLSQCISALAFCLSGYLVARAGFLSINAAAAWLPWIIACLTPPRDEQSIKPGRFLFLVFCIAMQLLAGHAQTTFYSMLLAGVWATYWAWNSVKSESHSQNHQSNQTQNRPVWWHVAVRIGKTWGWLALAVLLAIGLAAVQLIPTIEYLLQSQRAAAADYEFVVTYSFWPWHLVTLLAPEMFGSPVRGDYWGYANYWEDAIYIGLLPLLLAIGAFFSSLRRGNRSLNFPEKSHSIISPALNVNFTWFLSGLFWLTLLLALGKNTPVFPWFYFHIPTFDMFQAPARMMIWGVFALALLAGIGAHRWRRPEGRGLYWSRLGTMGAFAVTLGSGLAWIAMGDISPSFIRATALAGFWGLGSGLLTLTAPKKELHGGAVDTSIVTLTFWHWGVGVFVVLDLLVAGWGLNPGAELDIYQPSPIAAYVHSLTAGQRLFIPESDEMELKFERFLRFDTFHPGEDWRNLRAIMLPNENMLDGISSANNFDPLVPGRYAQWTAFLSDVDQEYRERLLNLMDVAVLQKIDPDQKYGVRFTSLDGSRRIRWVGCPRIVADGDQAWGLIVSGQVDFDERVLLEAALDQQEEHCPDPQMAQVAIESEDPGAIVIQVEAPTAGWLVLSDTWYPGWQARLDGEIVEILCANYLFRAVAVSAGVHEVVFKYRPLSIKLGIVFSLFSSALFLGLYFLYFRRPSTRE